MESFNEEPQISLEDFIGLPQTSLDIEDQTATEPPIKQETLFDEISGISLESFSEEPQISLEDFIDSVDLQTAACPQIKQETLFHESFIPAIIDDPPLQLFETSSLEPCCEQEESAYDKTATSELFKLVNELFPDIKDCF